MIQRIVLLELNDDVKDPAAVAAVAEHSREVLSNLPGVLAMDVGTAADEASAAAWDLSLVIRFAGYGDLEPFRMHPDHRAYVDDYLKPKLAGITAFNFDLR